MEIFLYIFTRFPPFSHCEHVEESIHRRWEDCLLTSIHAVQSAGGLRWASG